MSTFLSHIILTVADTFRDNVNSAQQKKPYKRLRCLQTVTNSAVPIANKELSIFLYKRCGRYHNSQIEIYQAIQLNRQIKGNGNAALNVYMLPFPLVVILLPFGLMQKCKSSLFAKFIIGF